MKQFKLDITNVNIAVEHLHCLHSFSTTRRQQPTPAPASNSPLMDYKIAQPQRPSFHPPTPLPVHPSTFPPLPPATLSYHHNVKHRLASFHIVNHLPLLTLTVLTQFSILANLFYVRFPDKIEASPIHMLLALCINLMLRLLLSFLKPHLEE